MVKTRICILDISRHITINIGYQPTIFAITTGQRVVLLTRKQQNQ